MAADPAAALGDGGAWAKFAAMVRAQGGDPEAELLQGDALATVTATNDGYLRRLDARAVGLAARRLGAGRARAQDPVSKVAGVLCLGQRGDRVSSGQPLLELVGNDRSRLDRALLALDGAVEISQDPVPAPARILERLSGDPPA